MEEKSSFRLVFGDTAIIKVLDFFLDNADFDYSLTDIAKNSDIGWSTLHLFFDDLIKTGIVVKSRQIGRAKMYKLNIKNPIVQKLIEIDFELSKKMIREELKKQNKRIKA